MASKSLGTLTVDLVARIGGFVDGMSKAEREHEKATKKISRSGISAAEQMERAQKRLAAAAAASTDAMSKEMTRAMREYERAQERMRSEAVKTQQELKRASEEMKRAADAKHTDKWMAIGRAGTMAFTAMTAAAGYFINNTMEATAVQAQLEAVIRSTGDVSGQTAAQLDAMSTALSRAGIASKNEVTDAQTTLLTFTNIAGKEFPAAMQVVMDMAARTGMSVRQSAETIGRALDIPSQGYAALSQQGFKFSEEQKQLIIDLEETGQMAAAQGIILEALQESYDGSADAARNTLGGALKALRNELKLTTTGDEGSVSLLTEAINELIDGMQSSAIKSAFGTLGALLDGLQTAARNAYETFQWVTGQVLNNIATMISAASTLNLTVQRSGMQALKGNFSGAVWVATSWVKGEAAKFKGGMKAVNDELMGEVRSSTANASVQIANGVTKGLETATDAAVDEAKILRLHFDRILGDQAKGTKSDPEYARQLKVINDAMEQGIGTAEEYKKARESLDAKFSRGEDKGKASSRGGGGGRGGKSEAEKIAEKAAADAERLRVRLNELHESAMLGYEQTLFMLGKEGEAAKALWDTEKGRYAELDPLRKQQIIDQAKIVDQKVKEQQQNDRFKDYLKDYDSYLADMVFEQELMGKSREEQQLIVLARQLELEIQERSVGLDEAQVEVLKGKREAILEAAEANAEMAKEQSKQIELMDEIRGSFGSAVSDFLDGSKSFKDSMMGALESIHKKILDMIAENLMAQLFGEKGSAGGGWFGQIIGAFAGGMGGGGGGHANGGHMSAGEFSRVNERGPEMLTTAGKQYLMLGDNSGTITPNHMLKGGGVQQTNNFVIQGKIDRRTQLQIAQETGRTANAAAARS